jgi:hypothetical protein
MGGLPAPVNLIFAWDDPTANCGYINNSDHLIIAAEEGCDC